MATVSDKSRQTYADADEFIQYQIDQARSRIKSTDLLTAIVLTGLLMVSYILIFTIFDHWVIEGGFSAWTRAGMLAVVLALCAGILYRYVLRPALWHIHPLYAARMLDKTSEGLEGSLLTLVDLQSGGRKSEESIQRTLEKRAAVRLADVHVDEAIDRRLLVRLTAAMFVVTAITCLYAVFSPKSISLLRPLSVANASVATRTVIDAVKPGSGKVPGGSRLDIIADISGVIPENVQVLYSTEDRRFVDEPLIMRTTDDPHRFQATMIGEGDRGLRQNFSYRVVAGDATSDTFSIVVEQPPTAQVVEVRYEYPDYMGLPNRTDASGTIEAWEGSTVTITAESSVRVETALLQLSDEAAFKAKGEEVRMDIRDRTLTAKLTLNVREDGTAPKFYRIQVFDADGHSDPEPVVYALEIRRDQAPVVKLHDPSRDLQVPANAIIPLLVEAEDPDFVLRSVTLHYSVNGRQIQPAEILLDTTRSVMPKRWMNTHDFRLEPLNLKAGDVVTYHIQARDNRPPLGNQGRTADLNLQILGAVSDAEAQEQLKLDREIQEQQRKNLEGMPENPAQPGKEPAENELPEGNEPQPMPDSDVPPQENAANDPLNDKSGDENNNASGTDQQQAGDSNSPQPAATGPTAKPNEGGETRPGNESPAQSSKRKLEDDEALQKLIEEMNRRREQDGESDRSDASSGEQSRAAEPTATKNKPNEDPRDGNESSSSNDDMNSEPSDSATATDAENKEEKSNKSGEKDNSTKEPGETKDRTNGKSEEKSDTSEKEAGDGGNSEPKSKTNDANTPSEDSEKMPGEKSATKSTAPSEPSPGDDSKQPNEQQGTTQPKSNTASEMKDNPDNGDNKQPRDNSSAQGTKQEQSKGTNDASKDQGSKNGDQKSDGSADSKNEPGMDNKANEKDKNAPNDEAGDQQGNKANSPDKQDDSKSSSNDKKGSNDPSSKDGKKSAGNDQKAGEQKSAAKEQADNQDKAGEKSGQKSNDQMNGEKSTQNKGEKSSNSKEKQGSNSDGNKSGEKGDKSSSKSNDKSGQQNGEKSGQDGNTESQAADSDMKSNDSNDAQQKSGDQKSGDNSSENGNEGDSKSGNAQQGDSKSGSKSGEAPSSGSKSGDSGSKSGGEKSSDSKSGESGQSKSADSKSGGEKSSGDQSGSKGSDSKSGNAKSSENKSDDGKSGDGESGDGESGGSKSEQSQGGDEKSSEGKAGGEKFGGEQSADGKSGDSKSGDSKSGGNKAGGKDSGGGKSGGKAGEGKSSSSSKGGQNSSSSGKSGPGQSTGKAPSGPAEAGGGGNMAPGDQQAEGIEGEEQPGVGTGMNGENPPVKSDPAVDEAAEAASLALKRLEKDLDRGTVDQKLLDELGWTAEELAAFKERLQKQLEERKLNEQQEKERSLSQKSFEEMLKSLDVKSAGKAREGRTDRDRDQQDTTNRQQVVPKRYQQWYEMYQRSISEGNKPAKGSNP